MDGTIMTRKEKLGRGEMIHLVAETTNICNHDCEYCYTVEYVLRNSKAHLRKLPGELELEERLKLIDEAAALGAITYDIVGAGEPTIDPHLFTQIEYAHSKGMVPVVFTNGYVLQKGNETEAAFSDIVRLFQECRRIDKEEFGIEHSAKMPYLGYGQTCTQYMGLYVTIKGDIFGCVGQSESYGNVKQRNLKDVWQERLPLLQKYNGGCPPRRKFYEQRISQEEVDALF